MVDAGSEPDRVGITRRERIQQRALSEILDAARTELRVHGPSGVTMRAVARAVDMTPSGLYRHVAGHDELLGLLAAQAYDGINEAITLARDRAPRGDHATAWYLAGMAMRQWYVTHLPEYELIASPRVIQAPPERLQTTARATKELLERICADAIDAGQLDPQVSELPVAAFPAEGDLPAAARSISMTAMAAMNGHIAFENRGLLAGLVVDPQEYFSAHLRGIMKLMGFVVEPGPLVMPGLR